MPPSTPKVLLIGWDAADWKTITPLMDAGKMPNLQRLVNEGVMGNLATLYPSLSPTLWTSIATGKRPFRHGILGFTEPDPHGNGIRPVSCSSRTCRALWNILQLHDLRSNVVGWWPSHPAEPISGVMVSNHFQRASAPIDQPWPLPQGTVHPPRLTENLARLRIHPCELDAESIALFVPDYGKIDQEKDHRLESLAKIIAENGGIHAAATALMQLEPWDFLGVYYDGIDHFCHGFMDYHPPRREGVDETNFELFKGVVESGYRYHDLMLGTLMALAGEDTTIILVSDHGFHPDHLRPTDIPVEPAGPAAQHRNQGILVMRGPGLKRDEIIHGASLLDINPTILHLFDLPVGEDMDGTPLVNAWRESQVVTSIPSWDDPVGDDGSHPAELQHDPVASREAIRQLVALGYIAKPDDNQETAVAETVQELDYNLARSYMDANLHLYALPLLKKLSAVAPEEPRFAIHLIASLRALGRTTEAGETLRSLLTDRDRVEAEAQGKLREWQEKRDEAHQEACRLAEEKGEPPPEPAELTDSERYELRRLVSQSDRNPCGVERLLAGQALAEGNAQLALEHLARAGESNHDDPELHLNRGEAYLALSQWELGAESFRQTLALDPESAAAHLGLCRSNLGRNRNKMALDAALTSLGLDYRNATAHYLLGITLHRLRRPLQAVEALKMALLLNPNHLLALERIALIVGKRLKDPVTAAEYRKKKEEARCRLADVSSGAITPDAAPLTRRTAVISGQKALELDPELPRRITSPLADTITIVSGLPRSGTSMMMQMLTASGVLPLTDDNRPPDDHNEKGYFEDQRAMALRKDASWLPEARGRVVKIVAQLLPDLPAGEGLSYGVLFMERDLDEVIASQRDMLAAQGKEAARIPEALLKHTYLTQLERVKKLLAIRKIPTLYIRHKDCIQEPTIIAARINAFLGGGLDEAAMTGAVTPRLYRHQGTEPVQTER